MLLRQNEERIEKLSQQNKLSKFCMDAGFLSVVENGQYFMTKDTGVLTQFNTLACREYTLPREEAASQPRGWIQGNTKIGPVLEVASSYLHGRHGVEFRIMSLSRDNTHSWVRISHGSKKFAMNLNNNETDIPEDQLEEYALKLDAKDFACISKAKAKPQRREPAGSSPRTVSIGKRTWTEIEPGNYSFSDYEVSKKVMYLLRHSQKVHREEDGAVHFWRTKKIFRISSHTLLIGLTVSGKYAWQEEEEIREDSNSSGTIVYFRALQGHSGRNLIDPSLQHNVVIQSNFFQYIYHVGCAFNLHSIISLGLIPGGQSSSKRQTVFFLPVDKNHKDPDVIDSSVPRRAQYLHEAWKRHQNAVFWVDINLAIAKGLTFYQTRSNAIILQETLPAYCIPKVVRLKTGEVFFAKVYMPPRPPPKIPLTHDWKRELDSEHAQRSEVGPLSRSFQSNQPILNPIRERTGRPVTETRLIQARSSEDSKDPNVGKAHERTRRLVIETSTENVSDSSQTRSFHESETSNVGDKNTS